MFATKSISDFSETTHVFDTSKVVGYTVGSKFIKASEVEKFKAQGWVVVDGEVNCLGNVKVEKTEPEFKMYTFKTRRSAEKFMKANAK